MRRTLLLAAAAISAAGLAFAQKGPTSPSGPDIQQPARYATIDLQAGFMPDPREVNMEAGGELDAATANLGPSCVGWIDATRADVTVRYQSGRYPLYLSAVSRADTTLVVRDPAGNWLCNDDLVGLNPGIVIQRPQSGEYRIWVGTLDRGPAQPAVLRVSEIPPGQGNTPGQAQGQAPNITAPARYATVPLTAGFMPDPHEIRVEAGGELDASAAGIGPECVGYIDATRADVILNYTAGNFPLYLSANSRADTTIVVRDPQGNWLCNDDLVGLDPGVVIQRPQSGEYRIWVGTLDRGPPQQAVMRISELPPSR